MSAVLSVKEKRKQKQEEEAARVAEEERLRKEAECWSEGEEELQEVVERRWITHGNLRQRVRHGMKYTMHSASFSPDGHYLVTGSSDKSACLWDLKNGAVLCANYEHQDFVYSVVFSPSGKYIATGCGDKEAKIWKVQSAILIADCEVSFRHRDAVVCVCYSPDGAKLASVSRDSNVSIHDVRESSMRARSISKERHAAGAALEIERQSSKENVKEEDRKGSKERRNSKTRTGSKTKTHGYDDSRKTHHEDRTFFACFNVDGELLVTASGWEKGYAIIFDVQSLDELLRIPHSDWVTSASFNPAGDMVVTTNRDKCARIWQLPMDRMPYGKKLQDKKDFEAGAAADKALADAGKKKVIMSQRKQRELKEAAERAELEKIISATELFKFSHQNWTLCATWSPDGTKICTGCDTGLVQIFEVKSGELMHRLDHKEPVLQISFSPNGRKLSTSSTDGCARIYGGIHKLVKPLEKEPQQQLFPAFGF